MSQEERELLARIGQLAGQINQRKTQSAPTASSRGAHSYPPTAYPPAAPFSSHAAYPPPPPARGRGWAPYRARGSRGRYASPMLRPAAAHRNRTLVLNNSTSTSSATSQAASTLNPTTPGSEVSSGAVVTSASADAGPEQQTQTGWVAKRDRHMQLINSALYEKEAEARARAIDETRKAKAALRDEREKARVINHARTFHTMPAAVQAAKQSATPSAYQITLHNIPFQVANGGSKLIRMSKDGGVTPKKVVVGGVPFVRSKTGNLHRLTAVVSKKRAGGIKKKSELCQRFTSSGYCFKGPSCRYTHDPSRVAICKDFLLTGKCSNGSSCDLSHDPTPERTPACVHFLRGRCNNDQCRYAHVRVSPGAPVCRDFAILGFCAKGSSCMERHVHECPDYANKGSCPQREKCTLPHVDRAGQIRKMASHRTESGGDSAAPGAGGEGAEEDDVSSDEEYGQLDSDDVSSDGDSGDEPVLILPGKDTGEVANQQDFIRF